MATAPKTIDVNAYIERKGLTPLAIFVLVLAFLMMMADGYDFGTLTTAANAILTEWKISRTELGAVFSITFIGLLGRVAGLWLDRRPFRPALHHHFRRVQFRHSDPVDHLGHAT